MNANTVNVWLAILTGLLALVTGYYAWVTHRILYENRKMTAETKRMADAAWKSYLQTVVPRVTCSCRALYEVVDQAERRMTYFAIVSITNKGYEPVRIRTIRVLSARNESAEQDFNRRLISNETTTIRLATFETPVNRTVVEIEDVAGERHEIDVETAHV